MNKNEEIMKIIDNINPSFQNGYVQINCKNCEFHGLNCELTNMEYLQWNGKCVHQK